MDEHLVEYALDLLDPVTTARVESHLKANPEARARLDLLEQALAPLIADDIAPPPGLTLGTLARIAKHRCMLPAAPPTPPNQAPSRRRRLRWPDGVVAALLLVLVGGLTFPLLARQWQAHQRAACANTMREIHAGLVAYGDNHHEAFPFIERTGPRSAAGLFVPLLTDAGLLGDVRVACPAVGAPDPARRTLAEMEALQRADPAKYREVAFDLAGRYAYSLGYLTKDNRHTGLRRDSGDNLPLLADAGTDGANSTNHGGAGQNVLHVGGHVLWCAHPRVGIDGDNIYLNQERRVRAGLCQQDSVLGAGNAQPFGMD
jgi:hypothetical protein